MDGQVIQLPELLYVVAEQTDGQRGVEEIASSVSEKLKLGVTPDNIQFLVEKKLRPLGVLAAADGSSPKLKRADPMLALNFRAALVPESVVRTITTIFYPLFYPPVIIAVLAALGALDIWLFFIHGVAQSVHDIVYQPVLLLMVLGMVVLSAAFHECGHATACRYGGAKPGVLGAGIYLVWPAFYSDVTDAYRLDKIGRLRTDLGGIYFNMIFSLLTAGAYFLTGFEPLLAVIVLQHFEMLHQLLPFLRLDGYYVIADLTGVPDMFARIKPILRSFIPGREPDSTVTALKPWVRVVVTGWVLAVIPILLYVLTIMAISAPRIFATAWDSFFVQYDKASSALSAGKTLAGVAGVVQMVSLVLPVGGISMTFGRVGKRLGTAVWSRTEGNPALRTGFVSTAVVAIGLVAFLWWPNGDYMPIQPGERGTIQGGLKAIEDIPSGRPGLTPEREAELNGAPTLREQSGSPAGTNTTEPDKPADEPAPETKSSDRSAPDQKSESQQPEGQQVVQPNQQPESQQQEMQPEVQPSVQPTAQPEAQPTAQPTAQPEAQPTAQPSAQPTAQPSTQPE